jgi:hypothetical protein
MKRLIAIAALLSGSLWAQTALEVPALATKSNGPSYSQQYCAGFISRHAVARTNYIVASKEAPHEDQYSARSVVFVGGPGLREGQRYSILRQSVDPNQEDSSPEQRSKLARLGRLYEEIGWMTVHSVQKGTGIATFDFACDTAVPGDIVVPFAEKPQIAVRASDLPVNQFMPSSGLTGHLLGSKEDLGLLGSGRIVYTDYGSTRGAHMGEYLYIRRGYSDSELNKIDRVSEMLPRGDAPEAANQAKLKTGAEKRLPSRVLGEMLVLNVSESASTGLITRSFAEIQLGDGIEREGGAVAAATSAAEPQQPCTASPLWRRAILRGHKCKAK